jgi:hypothetical protein
VAAGLRFGGAERRAVAAGAAAARRRAGAPARQRYDEREPRRPRLQGTRQPLGSAAPCARPLQLSALLSWVAFINRAEQAPPATSLGTGQPQALASGWRAHASGTSRQSPSAHQPAQANWLQAGARLTLGGSGARLGGHVGASRAQGNDAAAQHVHRGRGGQGRLHARAHGAAFLGRGHSLSRRALRCTACWCIPGQGAGPAKASAWPSQYAADKAMGWRQACFCVEISMLVHGSSLSTTHSACIAHAKTSAPGNTSCLVRPPVKAHHHHPQGRTSVAVSISCAQGCVA